MESEVEFSSSQATLLHSIFWRHFWISDGVLLSPLSFVFFFLCIACSIFSALHKQWSFLGFPWSQHKLGWGWEAG